MGGSDARCARGALANGGGWTYNTSPPLSATVVVSAPDGDSGGWHVIMANDTNAAGFDFRAVAQCTSEAGYASRRAQSRRPSIAQQLAAVRAAKARLR